MFNYFSNKSVKMSQYFNRSSLLGGLILIVIISSVFVFSSYTNSAVVNQSVKDSKIICVSRSVVAGEGPIVSVGRALALQKLVIQLEDKYKEIVYEQITQTDDSGNWYVSIDKDLNVGEYQLLVTPHDIEADNTSTIVSEIIKVRSRPTLVLGSFEINQIWFFFGLIILLSVAFVSGWYAYDKWFEQLNRRVIVAKRDVSNVFNNIDNDIDELLKNYTVENIEKCDFGKMKSILKNMKVNLEKTRHYIIDYIKDIQK